MYNAILCSIIIYSASDMAKIKRSIFFTFDLVSIYMNIEKKLVLIGDYGVRKSILFFTLYL